MDRIIKFNVKVYQSRLWHDKYLHHKDSDEIKELNQHEIYVVRITRIEV